MTDQTPVERAGNALMRNRAYQAGVAFGVPDETEAEAKHRSEIIKAVLGSIDTDQLARVIHAWDVEDGPCDGPFDDLTDTQKDVWRSAAHVIKNWLTGKDQQCGTGSNIALQTISGGTKTIPAVRGMKNPPKAGTRIRTTLF